MPLLADTIVECGRRTLSNAISLASKWGADPTSKHCGAEVIYGDTDSIFIKLPGRSVKEAFDFGKEFCNAVTASNPPPVQLKLEKVYGATLLQTVSGIYPFIYSVKENSFIFTFISCFKQTFIEKEILWYEIRISRRKITYI